MNEIITIEVVKGGFVLTHPDLAAPNAVVREVFLSARKLQQRLKDVVESLSLEEPGS